ncbi:hypothetical protein A3770_20p85770 [Chloropicon primus]|uniref:Uncharacterized protein n=1 Tax=Chloropicon primus TaxID=1764295 RepID=A0A5B8MZY8_9CHLO|nr:hypothetical protein A3770_20p85770 [Chloropicon primus]|eukprot:QDZ26059.1 hypothetical protein A3770_20p85770 [Chloropicon primus]
MNGQGATTTGGTALGIPALFGARSNFRLSTTEQVDRVLAQDPQSHSQSNVQWVLVSHFKTGGCYKGKRHAFPDQMPPELTHLVTHHEWMNQVYPEVSECLERFTDPLKYNYIHTFLTVLLVLQLGLFFIGEAAGRAANTGGGMTIAMGFPIGFLVYFSVLDAKAGQLLQLKLNSLNTYFSSRGISFYMLRHGKGGLLNFSIHCRIVSAAAQQHASYAGPPQQQPAPITHYVV